MAKSFKDIRIKVKELVDSQKNLKEAQAAYERMSRMQYTLPSPLDEFDWVRPIISTAPYDALRGVKRALANLEESLSIDPITVVGVVGDGRDSEAAKVEANDWETILLWQMQMASKRRAAMRSRTPLQGWRVRWRKTWRSSVWRRCGLVSEAACG